MLNVCHNIPKRPFGPKNFLTGSGPPDPVHHHNWSCPSHASWSSCDQRLESTRCNEFGSGKLFPIKRNLSICPAFIYMTRTRPTGILHSTSTLDKKSITIRTFSRTYPHSLFSFFLKLKVTQLIFSSKFKLSFQFLIDLWWWSMFKFICQHLYVS